MKRVKIEWLSIIILAFFSFAFYIKLFFPQLSLFFTPDLGRSDVFHYNFAKRFLLREGLKNGHLPLWSNKNGTGISLIGEGQIGMFHIVNFLLSFLFNTPFAFNLSYVVYSFIALTGSFALARFLNFSRFTSFFVALVFAFSGFFIFQITHTDIFSSAVFLPLVFLFAFKTLETRSLKDALFIALPVSQVILGGHSQIIFITLIGIGVAVLTILFSDSQKDIRKSYRSTLFLAFGVLLGFLLASIHILPLLEFKENSVRQHGLPFSRATENSLAPKFLLTFIYPFIFGTPANSTYPLSNANGEWNIFWEKIGYLGLIPLLFAFIAIFSKNENQLRYKKAFIILLVVSTLLALGKYSPLFFLFFFPPFNFFRNPARFILLMVFSLSFLAGFGLESFLKKITQKKYNKINLFFLKTFLLLIIFIPSFLISSSYHSLVTVDKVMKKPESVLFLEDKPGRTYQLGSGWPYLQKLLTSGWKDIDYYLFAKNSLDANMNVLFNIDQVGIYDGILTQRQDALQSLLINEAAGDLVNFTATASAFHQKILSLTNVSFLISPFKIDNKNLPLVETITPPVKTWPPFYIYENLKCLPRIRVVNYYQNAENYQQAIKLIKAPDFNPENTVVLENAPQTTLNKTNNQAIAILRDQEEEIILKTVTDNDGILVLADSFYPGWQAFVDEKQTKIYPANINQRAIFVPGGEHIIRFLFAPKSFKMGLTVSLISFSIWLVLLIKTFLAKTKNE